jgi:hypothetical protein
MFFDQDKVSKFPIKWATVTSAILIILVVELISMENSHNDDRAIRAAQKTDTTAIISTVINENRSSFTNYLSGFWTSKLGMVELNFNKPYTIKMPHQKPIKIQIIAQDFRQGNLEFVEVADNSKIGWIRKLWNADAVSLKMPGSPSLILYQYIPIRKYKMTTIKIKKDEIAPTAPTVAK